MRGTVAGSNRSLCLKFVPLVSHSLRGVFDEFKSDVLRTARYDRLRSNKPTAFGKKEEKKKKKKKKEEEEEEEREEKKLGPVGAPSHYGTGRSRRPPPARLLRVDSHRPDRALGVLSARAIEVAGARARHSSYDHPYIPSKPRVLYVLCEFVAPPSPHCTTTITPHCTTVNRSRPTRAVWRRTLDATPGECST